MGEHDWIWWLAAFMFAVTYLGALVTVYRIALGEGNEARAISMVSYIVGLPIWGRVLGWW